MPVVLVPPRVAFVLEEILVVEEDKVGAFCFRLDPRGPGTQHDGTAFAQPGDDVLDIPQGLLEAAAHNNFPEFLTNHAFHHVVRSACGPTCLQVEPLQLGPYDVEIETGVDIDTVDQSGRVRL